MADRVLCDTHVQVDPRITVSEGHYIADSVGLAVRNAHPEIGEVLVHIDTEDDGAEFVFDERLPDRAAVLVELAALIGNDPPLRWLQLHYIDGRVEVEAYFPPNTPLPDAAALRQRVDAWLTERPCYRGIAFYTDCL
jgi:hypothetical protein